MSWAMLGCEEMKIQARVSEWLKVRILPCHVPGVKLHYIQIRVSFPEHIECRNRRDCEGLALFFLAPPTKVVARFFNEAGQDCYLKGIWRFEHTQRLLGVPFRVEAGP